MPKGTHEKCSEHSITKNRNVIIWYRNVTTLPVALYSEVHSYKHSKSEQSAFKSMMQQSIFGQCSTWTD